MATDPVCGMFVEETPAALRLFRDNRTYYFCSSGCRESFAEPKRELSTLKRQLALAWPLSIAIVLLTYVYSPPYAPYVAAVLATGVQFYPGLPFYRGLVDALRSRTGNMDVLIAIGTSAAYFYSLAAFVPQLRLPPGLYFDASSLIVTLILTGNYLERFTRDRVGGTLRKLRELVPARARVLRDGREVEIPLEELRPGDLSRVRPGERFAADAIVREGRTTVEEAILTGESTPVTKAPGARVLAGSVNGEGVVLVEALAVGQDTFLAHVGQLVTEAETSRVPIQRLADRIAARFVPTVLLLGIAAAVGWFLAAHQDFTLGLLVFVSVVITACPCAFGIATPAALIVGTGRAAERGVLFKGESAIENSARVDAVVTDKTGTLTRGHPVVTRIVPAPGTTEAALLGTAAVLERASEHPIARAVRQAAAERGVPLSLSAAGEKAEPGVGVRGSVDGEPAAVLTTAAAAAEGVSLDPLATNLRSAAAAGESVSVVVRAGRLLGLLAFADEEAPGAREGIERLGAMGIRVWMATGDNESAAQRVAQRLGIHDVRAGLDPKGKLDLIRQLQQEGKRVAYVGDGINDAPALLAADLGVAIGAGTDVAQEAGQVILLRSDFRGVAEALQSGRRTVKKVRQNLLWAIGYNTVLLPIAAGALVPLFGLAVYNVLPITGAVAMGLSSTTVVLNSLSLRWG